MNNYTVWRCRGDRIEVSTSERFERNLPPLAVADTTGMSDEEADDILLDLEDMAMSANKLKDVGFHLGTLVSGLSTVVKMCDEARREGRSDFSGYNIAVVARNALSEFYCEARDKKKIREMLFLPEAA